MDETDWLTNEIVADAALRAGFMLHSGYGQHANELMPVSDSETLRRFIEIIMDHLPKSPVGKYVADYGPIPDLSGPTGAEELLASSRPSAVPEEIAELAAWLREIASGNCMISNVETFRRAADLLERQWEWDRKRAEDIITLGGEVGRLEQENAALRKDLDTVWIATGTKRPSDFFRPPSSEP